MVYTMTRRIADEPMEHQPLSSELQTMAGGLQAGQLWKPNCKLKNLPGHSKRLFAVQREGTRDAVVLNVSTWPCFCKDDYGRWQLQTNTVCYLNTTASLLELTHPELSDMSTHVPGTSVLRWWGLSSTMFAILWQKASDMPDQWQNSVGSITGVPAIVEDMTEQYLDMSIKLAQITDSNMKTSRAVDLKGALDRVQGNEPNAVAERVQRSLKAYSETNKFIIRGIND